MNQKRDLIERMSELVKEDSRTLGEMERELHLPKKRILELFDELSKGDPSFIYDEAGNQLVYNAIPRHNKFGHFEVKVEKKSSTKGLIFSDTHAGCLHAQLHLIGMAIKDAAQEEKPDYIAIPGDIHNGIKHADYARGGNILNTVDGQEALAFNAFSSLIDLGIPVFITSGDHDDWQWTMVGHNMVAALVEKLNYECIKRGKKPVFTYVSDETDYQFQSGEAVIELYHPVRGASRALSYGPQNIQEDRFPEFVREMRGEDNAVRQPHVIFYGQFHREIAFYYAGTVHVLVPGLQAKTHWERGKGLIHQVGAWIFDLEVVKTSKSNDYYNVSSFELRYINLWPKVRKHTIKQLESELVHLGMNLGDPERK